MALIRCPDCDRKVSDLAVACPECARPIAAIDSGAQRRARDGAEARRTGRKPPLVVPSPTPRPEAGTDTDTTENANRPPAPTFAVACSLCDGETILLYPRHAATYVCPDCEERSLLRGWARQVVLQWLPIALGVVVLLAVAALALRSINTGKRDAVVPHGE